MLRKQDNITNLLKGRMSGLLIFGVAVCLLLFLSGLAYGMIQTFKIITQLGAQLIALGWGKQFAMDAPLPIFGRCLMDIGCGTGLNQALTKAFPYTTFGMACAPLLIAALLYRFGTAPRDVKMPGQQRWATASDDKIKLYLHGDKQRPGNIQSGYLGYYMQPAGENKFDLKKLELMMPPVEDRCANTVIIAGVGGGKTSGLFIPQLMMDAIQGNTVVLFDLKYPNRNGFYNMIAFWARLGRRVQVFSPFADDTLRLPLLASITDMKSALEVADSIITPPEFQKETGEHFKNIERHTLASIMLAVANHPVPSKRTFREVLRIAQSTKVELENWYQREGAANPDIKEAMKGLFDRSAAANADMLRGLVSELKIFFDPLLERATTSSPGKNLELSFDEPTLYYIAIGQEHIMDGSGEPLLKLIKRMFDRAILEASKRQGGTLNTHVEIYLDEFNSFGRFGNMMRTTATFRERNVGMTIGIQNSKQGQVVYGPLYYEAMTENVIGHTILLPYGITGDDAIKWSKILGNTSKIVPGMSSSNQQWLPTPFSGRTSSSERIESQAFLPPEEFATYTKNEGVLIMMGCPPTRIKLPRFDAPYVVPRPIWKFWSKPVHNRVWKVYRNVMGKTKPGELSDQYMADPAFRFAGTAQEEVSLPETPEALFHTWISEAIEQGASVRLVRASTPPKMYVASDSFATALSATQLSYLADQVKWLARGQAGNELRITESGQALLGEAKNKQLGHLEVMGPIIQWMRRRAAAIEHHPLRDALPEEGREEASAYYEFETLALPSGILKELLGVVPELPTKRIGSRNLVIVPLNDPARLWEAVTAAREKAANLQPSGWGAQRVELDRQRLLAAREAEDEGRTPAKISRKKDGTKAPNHAKQKRPVGLSKAAIPDAETWTPDEPAQPALSLRPGDIKKPVKRRTFSAKLCDAPGSSTAAPIQSGGFLSIEQLTENPSPSGESETEAGGQSTPLPAQNVMTVFQTNRIKQEE